MQPKAITNSVTKWEEISACKVKSILERIRSEGKDNDAAIKQVDKQKWTVSGTRRTRNLRKREREEGTVQYILHVDNRL